MTHYVVMPIDYDLVEEDLRNKCGSLYPYITKERNAIAYVKKIKKSYPNVKIGLYEGETWGNLKLVKEF